MSISSIPPVGAGPAAGLPTPAAKPASGFGDAIAKGLEQVSQAEHAADGIAQDIASGGDADVHQLMASTTQASLAVDLLVQVRNRAVEAYQEIMRIQV